MDATKDARHFLRPPLRRVVRAFVAVLLAGTLHTAVALGQAPGPPVPPPITPLRHAADYGYLAGRDTLAPERRTLLDPVKYVRLGGPVCGAADSYASFGGELRIRPEFVRDDGLAPGRDGTWTLVRAAAYADLRLGGRLRGFAQLYSATRPGNRELFAPVAVDWLLV